METPLSTISIEDPAIPINIWMQQTFKRHYNYCVDSLVQKNNIYRADAENYLMDAIIILHEKKIEGSFKSENIKGWLITVCLNMHKKEYHKQKKNPFLTLEKMESYLGYKKELFSKDFNPMVLIEEKSTLLKDESQKMESYLYAMSLISETCRAILNRLREGAKLITIKNEMNYSSYNSIKSSKSRCLKKLKIIAKKHYDQITHG